MKCSNVRTKTDLFPVQLISGLSEILLFCNGEWALTSIKSTWLKAGTHQTDTRRTAGDWEAGRTKSRWSDSLWAGTEYANYYSCEETLLFELADMARGEAKNDPENTPEQQSHSLLGRCVHRHKHTYTHIFWHSIEIESKCWNWNWQTNHTVTLWFLYINMYNTHTHTDSHTLGQE